MTSSGTTREKGASPAKASYPPGKRRLMESLRSLLEEKDFGTVTTAEIARRAGVTEPLIYKYFDDKRDLLHQVLSEHVEHYHSELIRSLGGIKGALNKLRKIMWVHLDMYAADRVFAKILLLEVRNYPGYFQSEAYQMVKRYTDMLLNIIEEGMAGGEIRDDIPAKVVRQLILGAIEHVCLPSVIFNREIDPDQLTDHVCELCFNGLRRVSGNDEP